MKSMFDNYDNHIDRKDYPEYKDFEEPTRVLESNPNLSLIVDAFGNEIGICARQYTPFSLYFVMDGCVENSSIEQLVYNSKINFKLIDYWHKTVLDKVLEPSACYIGDNTLCINLSQSDVDSLKQESYRINLSLFWSDGYYCLYSEDSGIITIK